MTTKPTYEEFEQRVEKYANEALECKKEERVLQENETQFRRLPESARDVLPYGWYR